MENVKMQEVFEEIETLTDFKFFYDNEKINTDKLVSVTVTDTPVSEVLNILFGGSGIQYVLKKKQIVLKLKTMADQTLSIENLSAPLPQSNVLQQQVSGTITDANGTPIPGVSVLENNTTNGTASDFDGNYSIEVSGANAVLVFSSIGFAKQEISVGQSSTINVTMVEDAQNLDEVVVTA
ncbi:MAG: hypothetical protein HKN31_02650, partial [Pricia sp.]|nr:hypothetical protein [Pricia sp.]